MLIVIIIIATAIAIAITFAIFIYSFINIEPNPLAFLPIACRMYSEPQNNGHSRFFMIFYKFSVVLTMML